MVKVVRRLYTRCRPLMMSLSYAPVLNTPGHAGLHCSGTRLNTWMPMIEAPRATPWKVLPW